MALASLRAVCLDRIYRYLREGMWKFCPLNPFSQLPAVFVDELMKFTESHDTDDCPRIEDVILLLKSGRLKYLNLCAFSLENEINLISREKYGRNCRISMEFFSLAEDLVRQLISWNPHLEEIHLEFRPNFEVFRDCQNLRTLRFFVPPHMRSFEVYRSGFPTDLSVLSSLRDLEVFYDSEIDTETKIKLLDNCPKLISLGLVNSLDAMKEIYTRSDNSSLNFNSHKKFQLRRCVWDVNECFRSGNSSVERCTFQVRCAASLCPDVEELVFCPLHLETLRELKSLKCLTLLRIAFCGCQEDFVTEFLELLQEIGSNLKHLSIDCQIPVPVDVVTGKCPELQSFEVVGPSYVMNSADVRNLSLRRLRLEGYEEEQDKESFQFLLSCCKSLEGLYLSCVAYLDDNLLHQIWNMNPLAKLKSILIASCRITQETLQMFIKNVVSLEKIYISSFAGDYECVYDRNSLFKDPNLRYKKNVEICEKEFLHCYLNIYRF